MADKPEKKPRPRLLKACPFCGGQPFLNIRDDPRTTFAVTCNDCTAQGPWERERESAVERWNRRTL